MNATSQDNGSPIYQQLVREHGDVVAEAEATATQAWTEVRDALRRFTVPGSAARSRHGQGGGQHGGDELGI